MSWVKSNNVVMFPSSLRGNVVSSTGNKWDPQSRFTTEPNLTSLINRLCGKSSFVISSELVVGVSGNYEFNIRGYYFKVIDTTAAFSSFSTTTNIYAIIQLKDIDVSLPDSPVVALGTLVSVESTPSTILDSTDVSSSEFKGLLLSDSTTGYTDDSKYYYLKIATRATTSDSWSIPEDSKLKFWGRELKDGSSIKGAIENTNNITPQITNTYTVGVPTNIYANMYATTFTGALAGNASTSTKLATARLFTITDNDSSHIQDAATTFDGSAAYTLKLPAIIKATLVGNADTVTNGVYTTGNQIIAGMKTFSSTIQGSVSGNASTSTKLATARLFTITDNDATNSQQAPGNFDGSADYTIKLPATIKATLTGTADNATNTGFTNTNWTFPALAINGTLPSNVVGKTLEIGVMYEDSQALQSRYYNFGIITLRALNFSDDAEWYVGAIYIGSTIYSLSIGSTGAVYFSDGSSRITSSNYKLHYRIIT